jgi:hypothetical protein
MCGTQHAAIDGLSLRSRFDKRDFGTANGRDAASADSVAHLPPDLQTALAKDRRKYGTAVVGDR